MRSANFNNASARSCGVVADHSGNAAAAAVTAASTSAAWLEGTSAIVSPVAGSRTGSVRPEAAGTHLPPM